MSEEKLEKLTGSPEDLDVETIVEWLAGRGLGGVSGKSALAAVLGVTERTVGNFVRRGLRPIAEGRSPMFDIGTVAEWLSRNPKYVAQRPEREWCISEETVGRIRAALRNWQPLLRHMEEADVVTIVLEELSRMPREKRRCSEYLAIHRAIGRIWERIKRKPLMNSISIELKKEL